MAPRQTHHLLLAALLLTLALVRVVNSHFQHQNTHFVTGIEKYQNDSVKILEELEDEVRILGGTAAALGNFPYMAAIVVTKNDASKVYCGGTILSPTFVLTAAQCLVQAASIEVRVGTVDPTTGTKVFGQPIIHPNFVRYALLNDMGLVNLLDPLTFGANIKAILLPTYEIQQAASVKGVMLTTMGYGRADNMQTWDVTLKSVKMAMLPLPECNKIMSAEYIQYSTTHFCLETAAKTKGFCFGDKGGPVVYINSTDKKNYLAGVLSDYIGCPTRYPNAYTRSGPFLYWIRTTVTDLPT